VANLGGNSDVATAAYGQLAGAYYGVGAIPGTWRNSLIGKDSIEMLADRLLAHAMVTLGGAD
jgi:ADP-ribosyl-[dinitrogen reductase] hydrolase